MSFKENLYSILNKLKPEYAFTDSVRGSKERGSLSTYKSLLEHGEGLIGREMEFVGGSQEDLRKCMDLLIENSTPCEIE